MLLRIATKLALEAVLKGIYLGLAYTFVVHASGLLAALSVLGWTLAVTVLALAARTLWSGQATGRQVARHWFGALVLAVLDNPAVVFAAVLTGIASSGLALGWPWPWLLVSPLAGALAGLALHAGSRIPNRWLRVAVTMLLIAGGLAALWASAAYELVVYPASGAAIAAALGASAVLFYLLTFSGQSEESELEVGLLCFALAIGLGQLGLPLMLRRLAILLPIVLFILYCERMRRQLIVFKHVLRGLSHEQQGALRDALIAYRRALAVTASSELAVAGNWRVHRKLNLAELADDPDILALIDPLVCLERARSLLDRETVAPESSAEADKLLGMVALRRPDLPITIGHQRVRLLLARGDGPAAFAMACELIDRPAGEILNLADHEAEPLFATWMLLLKHPLLAGTGGLKWIEGGAGLFGFLAALERRRRQWADDPDVAQFEPFVYRKLSLAELEAHAQRAPADPLDWLNHVLLIALAEQAEADGERDRAVEYLQIAELGMPDRRLQLWHRIALLVAPADPAESMRWLERIKRLGIEQRSEAERSAFFDAVRRLAEHARAEGRLASAIDNYRLYGASPHAGLDTLRELKELQEQSGDVLGAIGTVERAHSYSLAGRENRLWNAEKRRLYEKVRADELAGRLDEASKFFDFDYCLTEARRRFEANGPAEEVTRYCDLAALGGQLLLNVNVLLGRANLRAGRRDDAIACLEAARTQKPERFDGAEQEEAYYTACRLLGDLYLEKTGEPAKAVECLSIYKEYVKSGADTLYNLARAYERTGEPAHAKKWYDMVLVYPHHPKADAARAALERLKGE